MNPGHQPDAVNDRPSFTGLCEAVGRCSPVPMVAVQEACHLVRYANPAFCHLTGKSGEEIIGRPFAEVVPDNGRSLALLDHVYRTGEPETFSDPEVENAGSVFWSYSIWPVKSTDEDASGIVVVVTETTEFPPRVVEMNQALVLANLRQHEMTEAAEKLNARLREEIHERKQTEEALRESERRLSDLSHSLEGRVEERTTELMEQTTRLRYLTTELVSAEQRERKRLAALLHDDLQQLLVAAKINLDRACRSTAGSALEAVQNASRYLTKATTSARHLTHQLRPPVLYEDGLVAALHGLASEMAERHDLRLDIQGEPEPGSLSNDLKALLFDAVRELLFNVVKHASVSEARVRVSTEGGLLRVQVEDGGAGFDARKAFASQESTGFGLFSIRERLAAMGGKMVLESQPGAGTLILLEAPLAVQGLPEAEAAAENRAESRGIRRRGGRAR